MLNCHESGRRMRRLIFFVRHTWHTCSAPGYRVGSGKIHWTSCKNQPYKQICSYVSCKSEIREFVEFTNFLIRRNFSLVQMKCTTGPGLLYEPCSDGLPFFPWVKWTTCLTTELWCPNPNEFGVKIWYWNSLQKISIHHHHGCQLTERYFRFHDPVGVFLHKNLNS